MGACAAGATPDLTQNGVAAIAHAMGECGAGGADVVGAGAAGGSGRPTVAVTPPANVRGDLAGAFVYPPRLRLVPPSVRRTNANRVCSTILQGTSSHSSSSSTARFDQACVLFFFHSKRK